jgi:hypothetical protein
VADDRDNRPVVKLVHEDGGRHALPLATVNIEKLEALADAYGVSLEAAVNIAVSDAYDAKVAALRDAVGD